MRGHYGLRFANKGYFYGWIALNRPPYCRDFIRIRVVDYTQKWAYCIELSRVLFLPVNV